MIPEGRAPAQGALQRGDVSALRRVGSETVVKKLPEIRLGLVPLRVAAELGRYVAFLGAGPLSRGLGLSLRLTLLSDFLRGGRAVVGFFLELKHRVVGQLLVD